MQQGGMRLWGRLGLRAWIAACILVPLTVVATDRSATAAGSREAGLHLAQHWCTGCHALSDTFSATDVAPSFPQIARTYGDDESWLRTWLMAPHPRMPNFSLSRSEIDDLVAYLSSLDRGGR